MLRAAWHEHDSPVHGHIEEHGAGIASFQHILEHHQWCSRDLERFGVERQRDHPAGTAVEQMPRREYLCLANRLRGGIELLTFQGLEVENLDLIPGAASPGAE